MVVLLVVAWCALWEEFSPANILSGLAVAVVVLAAGIGPPARGGIRVWPLTQLGLLVLKDLVSSTVSVASEVLTPTDHTNEAVVAVELPVESRRHAALLAAAVTVTPGTAVVDADADTGTLYLHLLHAGRRDEVEAHVRRLAALSCRALPVPPEEAGR
jgi:multicomponent Na+:H+ antiporter subunit E